MGARPGPPGFSEFTQKPIPSATEMPAPMPYSPSSGLALVMAVAAHQKASHTTRQQEAESIWKDILDVRDVMDDTRGAVALRHPMPERKHDLSVFTHSARSSSCNVVSVHLIVNSAI